MVLKGVRKDRELGSQSRGLSHSGLKGLESGQILIREKGIFEILADGEVTELD